MAIQHKGNAAGIKRRIRKIPPPCARHRHICIGCRPWRHARQIPAGGEHQRPASSRQSGTAGKHRRRILRQAVKAQRLQLNVPVKADDADLRKGHLRPKAHRLAAIEVALLHYRARLPGFGCRRPLQRGAGCQRIAGDVLPHNAGAIKTAQTKPSAIRTARQPMRQREFLGMRRLHYKANTSIGVQQQAARGRRNAIQPIPGKRRHGGLGGGGGRHNAGAFHANLCAALPECGSADIRDMRQQPREARCRCAVAVEYGIAGAGCARRVVNADRIALRPGHIIFAIGGGG